MFRNISLVALAILVSAGFALAEGNVAETKAADHGGKPWVVDIEKLTTDNGQFRSTYWSGKDMQMTVMSIVPGGEIGLEAHPEGDQFIRVEAGEARVVMGETKDAMTFDEKVSAHWAIFIPGGYWHNIINTGNEPLKVYVIYAPPQHAAGTIHKTFEEAEAAHKH
ncbi:MAG TPA: cupin domain-containing protein [bacterium]|nr:cupin domain-containing protein [bacterium]